LRLLKSGEARLVARTSNKHVRAQLVTMGHNGDETEANAHSQDLAEFGWEAPTGNLPAAYLTGYLAGVRGVAAGVETAVLDIGLNTATPGAKVFAVQEGAIDAGLSSPHNESVFAEWERTSGEHIATYAQQLEEPLYSGDLDATELPEHFDDVRDAITEEHNE
jgi:large subunit ribosomal protein L18